MEKFQVSLKSDNNIERVTWRANCVDSVAYRMRRQNRQLGSIRDIWVHLCRLRKASIISCTKSQYTVIHNVDLTNNCILRSIQNTVSLLAPSNYVKTPLYNIFNVFIVSVILITKEATFIKK